MAEIVAQMAALAETQAEIAQAVGLSVKTLTRIYAEELDRGAQLIRRAVLAGQVKKAVDGNTQAARFVETMLTKSGERQLAAEYGAPRPERRSPQPGLKEQRQAAAEQHAEDSLFAPGAPPERLTH